jgi:glyoxylase-like metal-dependent hydrolase (beta-lactamase superfamily II)
MQANCYLVCCEETACAAIIDPGGDAARIMARVRAEKRDVTLILNTHGHADHIGANDAIRKTTGAKVAIHADDAPMLTSAAQNLSMPAGEMLICSPADLLLRGGERLLVGKLEIEVIHTPGHTPGSVCFLSGQSLFSGDTLFAMSVGRTDFPGGSAGALVKSISGKLLTLPDETKVLPGHGQATTIGLERASNPFLRVGGG